MGFDYVDRQTHLYFPGCTLSTKARSLDVAARAAASSLGVPLQELPDWTCCGATFPLAVDNLMALSGPARILADARLLGAELVTLCAACYNILQRTNHWLRAQPEKRDTLNYFIERDYRGDLRVMHYLELLRDVVGFETVAARVVRPLAGLRVAPYYGCLLLRPPGELGLDDPERPTLLGRLLASLGCQVVEYPMAAECCGSYLAVSAPEAAAECTSNVLLSAARAGADCIVAACPLCHFNLGAWQDSARQRHPSFGGLPVYYFTELLALALGVGDELEGQSLRDVMPS